MISYLMVLISHKSFWAMHVILLALPLHVKCNNVRFMIKLCGVNTDSLCFELI
jgi:hypothetical protein